MTRSINIALKLFILALVVLGEFCWHPVAAYAAVGDEYLVQIDPGFHRKFGLYYPATYKFRLPVGAHDLVGQFRYADRPWTNLPEKRSGDFFNGIDAARFDYGNGFAYLSARFSLSSDSLYLRAIDSAGTPVPLVFDSIPKYYDDRKGAVAITVDDWNIEFDAASKTATDYLVSRNLYFTVAVIAADVTWSSVQQKIDQYGPYMEVASHSLHHPCSASAYGVSGYQAETAGSRDAITANLTFPNYPYVPAYIEPCGYSDSSLYSAISGANYIVERSSNDYFGTASRFIDWDAFQGRYGRAGVTYNDAPAGDTPLLLSQANAAFDKAMAAGGIYSLEDHPYNGYWHDGSYLLQHLDHIKGRSDVWYVPFGQMYQYHFLQEMRGNLTVQQLLPSTLSADFSATPVAGNVPLQVAFTDASLGTVNQWTWDFGDGGTGSGAAATHTYLAAGSYPVTLTVTGPMGTDSKSKPNYINVSVASSVGVTMTSPSDGSSFTAPATIPLAATTGSTVSKIDFYAGNQLIGTATAPPYSFTWSNVPPGRYLLTAQETDLSRATATSPPVSITVYATVPAAPVITGIRAANGGGELSFTAPPSDGGSPIASYTVTAAPGNIIAMGSGSPISVAGLSNGVPYTFTISATNGVGTGAVSAPVIAMWPPVNGTVISIAPAAASFGPGGGSGVITVAAADAWSASTWDNWINITSGSSYTNSGTLSYTVSPNDTGRSRTGTIAAGNQYFTVRQAGNDFSDNSDPSAWFYPYINSLNASGISKGCGDSGNFCTADPVTREQMAAFIVRALNGEKFTYSTLPYFTDVPPSSWSYPYVQKLKDLGLTTNTQTFQASGYVTREQAATFIIRALYGERFSYPTTPYFSDVPPSAWSFKYVQKLKEVGLTTSTGVFDALGIVTRDQMATFISRAFLDMMSSSTDVPSNNSTFRAGMIVGKSFDLTVPGGGTPSYTFDENGTFTATGSGGTTNYAGSWIINNSNGTLILNNIQGTPPGYTETFTLTGGAGVFPLLVNYRNSSGVSGTNMTMTGK